MRNISDCRGLSTNRSIGEEISSSVDPAHSVVHGRDGAGENKHLSPISTSKQARSDASGADADSREDAVADAEEEKPFGGLTASEAAHRRWAQAREEAALAEEAGDDPAYAIAKALERKARKGDVNAAREYREWLALRGTATQGDAWMAVLTPEQRATLRAWIAEGLSRAD
jgi:hypothetical protein